MKMDCVIYTKENCTWCVAAKDFMQRQQTTFNEVHIVDEITPEMIRANDKSYIIRDKLMELFPGVRTVPIITIDGQFIGGYNELVKYFTENGLMLA
jgi:glutaredoxin